MIIIIKNLKEKNNTMSGWNEADKMMEEDMPFDFPAVNNITIAGYLPHDQVPSPGKCPISFTAMDWQITDYIWPIDS